MPMPLHSPGHGCPAQQRERLLGRRQGEHGREPDHQEQPQVRVAGERGQEILDKCVQQFQGAAILPRSPRDVREPIVSQLEHLVKRKLRRKLPEKSLTQHLEL